MQLQTIESKIYTLRGQKVMLDRDLAAMYGVETRRLNEQVRRNLRRFEGDDFMFQLSQQEFEDWKSQFATSNSIKMGMRKKPYAFTELGVAMLSSVLHSDIAIEINKSIMRAFVTIRQTLSSVPTDAIGGLQREILELRQYMEDVLIDQNDINEDTRMQLELINQTLAEMQAGKQTDNTPRRRVGY